MALTARAKRPSHHKKISGKHHRHSDPYLKTYWPYLPMLLIVGLGIVINGVWSGQKVLGTSSDYSSAALLNDTNAQRAKNHEPALSINQQLRSAAQAKANDMAQRNYWSHNTPDGQTPWSFITTAGYHYQAAGENLAYGFNDAADAVAGWMNSPEHRANILNASYQNVGFGVASSPDYQGQGPETIVVAEYATPASTLAASNAAPASTDLSARPVSRIQLMTDGNATWSALALSALTGAAVTLFIVRHGFRLKRALNHGEAFVAHHPYIDIAIVLIITIGLLLTRTSGLIR